jgi:hypothetical protein
MSDVVPEAAPEPGAAESLMSSRRLTLILGVLVLEVAVFLVGLLTPLSDANRQSLANMTANQLGSLQSGSVAQLAVLIFAHNLSIALAEMVPVAGALVFAVSVYTTGLAAQALVSSQGLPTQWGAVIFAFPYSIVELTAYAVAVVAGSMLLAAWRRGRLIRELKVFLLEGVAVVLILFVAAAMEAATIQVSPLLGFALWVPTGLAIAAAAVVAGKKRR